MSVNIDENYESLLLRVRHESMSEARRNQLLKRQMLTLKIIGDTINGCVAVGMSSPENVR